MRFIVLGSIGSDAGYWIYENGQWQHVGGWGTDRLAEVAAAIAIIRESTNFKTPGLAEAATRAVAEFAEKELGGLAKGGGVVVIA
jgi:hypothetical protein